MAELKGSKTAQNLASAFAGESQARNKYGFYAEKAREEGYEQIADIFEETARNERAHAKLWFKLLHEKSAIECLKPFQNRLIIIFSCKGILRQTEDFFRRKCPAEHII